MVVVMYIKSLVRIRYGWKNFFINSVLSIPLRQHTNGRQQYLRILGDYFSFYEAGWKHLLNKAMP